MVLVEINFDKKEEVYEKAKLGLNKYLAAMGGNESSKREEKATKLESGYFMEEALLVLRGYYRGCGCTHNSGPEADRLGRKPTRLGRRLT